MIKKIKQSGPYKIFEEDGEFCVYKGEDDVPYLIYGSFEEADNALLELSAIFEKFEKNNE